MIRFLIAFLCLSTLAQAQKELPLWFSEEFKNNTNRWDDWQEFNDFVRNNALYVHANKDFRILAEMDSRMVLPMQANSWGLSWGRKSMYEFYYFEINNKQQFRVGYQQGERYIALIDWKKSKEIEPEINTLEVIRKGEDLYCKINGKEVYKRGFPAFFGSEVSLRSSDRNVGWRKLEIYQEMGPINVSEAVKDYKTEKENLGGGINSTYIDKFPVISPDGKILYYLRENYPDDYGGQDIWFAERRLDGQWSEGKNIGRGLNNEESNFVNSVMPDNNTLCISNSYRGANNPEEIIAFTHRTVDGWSRPQGARIRNLKKQGRWVSFYLGADGRTLIFTMMRPDSYGGRDLYVSFLQDDGTFSEPKNLGPTLNTAGNEHCPFLAADGKTLYFDTDGHPGYGGRDIFVSRRLDDSWTNWTKPENMGPAINTSGSDEGIMIPASGEYAYFVSDQNSIGALDIFRLRLPDALKPLPTALLRGKVTTCEGTKPVEALLRVYVGLEERAYARSNPSTGDFQLALPAGQKYRVEVAVNESRFKKLDVFEVDLTDLGAYEERDLDAICVQEAGKKEPILVPEPIVKPTPKPTPKPDLMPVYFAYDKHDIRKESQLRLDSIYTILVAQADWKIELTGHTDGTGPDDYNARLSEKRVLSVADYLIKKGLPEGRIIQRLAKGEKEPVDDNTTVAGRARNRRVELRVVD